MYSFRNTHTTKKVNTPTHHHQHHNHKHHNQPRSQHNSTSTQPHQHHHIQGQINTTISRVQELQTESCFLTVAAVLLVTQLQIYMSSRAGSKSTRQLSLERWSGWVVDLLLRSIELQTDASQQHHHIQGQNRSSREMQELQI